jgi:hypothetical protein
MKIQHMYQTDKSNIEQIKTIYITSNNTCNILGNSAANSLQFIMKINKIQVLLAYHKGHVIVHYQSINVTLL